MKEKSSGLDALLDALKQSGVDMGGKDSPFGGGSGGGQGNAPDSSQDEGASGSRGDNPFAGFPFGGSGGSGGSGGPGLSERLATWGKRAIIIAIIVILIVAAVAYWWFHPPINIHSTDTWSFITLFILLPLFLFFMARSRAYRNGTEKVKQSDAKAKTFKWLSYLPVAVLGLVLVGALASATFFPGNAEKYANILQTETHDFTEDIQEVDYSQIPVIDRDSAVLLGNRTLGAIPDYVSQFEISPLYSQINYQGTPMRVSPLGYADFFKWLANREAGLPAYVLVNMTTQDTQIVRFEGEGMHYSQSEPFFRNVDRHIQLSYPFYMLDEISFEIDDDGNPWWIAPVQTREIGLFGGRTIHRVILCDAITGECQDLAIEDCPQWVDRAYPADLLVEQYNWSGAYSSGWINSWLGQQGVVQTTPGTNGLQGYNYIAKDDDVWVYTGVTSATADNSIVGFVLVNQRTAESHFYAVAGATEESAMRSAEGQVQHLGYSSTFPLLINISGVPTYFMALKDDAGLVKMFAMIDIQRYQNVAVGDTVAQCQQQYRSLLATNGVVLADEVDNNVYSEASGTIERIVEAVVDGNSHFYVKLAGDTNLYDFGLPEHILIIGYDEGDDIAFKYLDGDGVCVVEQITGAKAGGSSNAAGGSSNAGSSGSAAGAGSTGSGDGAASQGADAATTGSGGEAAKTA